ncbi:unnamed protein product [Adineta ricciae]|uniref:DUF4139 domain-containing protein n=1 Tax=Adineta ricciae TaxID=249248 RepID=A0A813RXG5_ADIRI|nr:unnamed protein product [Adineta ricciae]CAF0891165.1 unnamed protein product [Adineta ricciae]
MSTIFYIVCIFAVKIILSASIDKPNNGIRIQIYDNIAEITRPISPYADLPMIFSQQEWYDIRSDSFRLIGDCVHVHGQTISFNRTSLNGHKILIKRNVNNDTYTEGIMIDETRNLIQDLTDNTYYVITNDRIRYLSIPPVRNYTVDFILESYTNKQLYVRYLQNNIRWKVHYDLLLENNDAYSILQAYASVRNSGDSSLMIDYAELISGDVNIQSTSNDDSSSGGNPLYAGFADGNSQQVSSTPVMGFAPTISESEELVGVYLFRINETFVLDPRSTFILPMFRPTIDIERYGSIEKYFSSVDNHGNARRAYRLRVEKNFLPAGKVFVRESDRLVGETYWSDVGANQTNEFSLGQDPDLQYIEYVQLDSRRNISNENTFPLILSTYTIDLHLINNKQRDVTIEYRLKFSSQVNLSLKDNSTNSSIVMDGASLLGIFRLNANGEQYAKFTFETQ